MAYPQIKFLKKNGRPESAVPGSILFNTSNKTIEVVNANGDWESFAGALADAVWADEKLTISKHDGSTIELDFSGVASLAGVQAALSQLSDNLTTEIDKAKQAASNAQTTADQGVSDAAAAQTAAAGAQSHSEGVATNLSIEITNRTEADTKIKNAVGLNSEGGHVATTGHYTSSASKITEEIAALDSALYELAEEVKEMNDSDLADIKQDIGNLQAADVTMGTRVSNIETAIDALDGNFVITGDHVSATLTQTDGKVSFTLTESDIASHTALSTYMTTNDAALAIVKGTADAALPASTFNTYKSANDQEVARVAGLVDTFFNGAMTDDELNQYKDTLKELQDYITEDTSAAATMAANIQANANAIGAAASEGKEATGLYKVIADADAAIVEDLGDLEDRVKAIEDDTTLAEHIDSYNTTAAEVAELKKATAGYSSSETVKADVNAAKQAAQNAATAASNAQTTADAKIASVTGDTYVVAVTDTDHKVTLTTNVSALSADASGLAKAADVYEALCWAEFE